MKVQRPNLTFILRRDLVLIRLLGVITAPLLPLNLGFGLGDIIDEFGRSLFEEIDYVQEADNAERFASLFADNDAVYVPRVERMLSSTRVHLTAKGQPAKHTHQQPHSSHQVWRLGQHSHLQQHLELFSGDLLGHRCLRWLGRRDPSGN